MSDADTPPRGGQKRSAAEMVGDGRVLQPQTDANTAAAEKAAVPVVMPQAPPPAEDRARRAYTVGDHIVVDYGGVPFHAIVNALADKHMQVKCTRCVGERTRGGVRGDPGPRSGGRGARRCARKEGWRAFDGMRRPR